MAALSRVRKQDPQQNPIRHSFDELSTLLPKVQTRNIDLCQSRKYYSYQRARRTDAEPITRSQQAHGLSALFF